MTSFMLGLKCSMIPDRTADATYASAWLEVSVRIAVSCAYRIISNKPGKTEDI